MTIRTGLALAAFFAVALSLRAQSPLTQPAAGAAKVSIHGHVQLAGTEGRFVPVRHARVTLTTDRGDAREFADSDGTGEYVFTDVPPGPYRLTVVKAGYLPLASNPGSVTAVGANNGQRANVDLVMERAAALDGRVIDSSGSPLAGLIVSAERAEETPPGQTPQVSTATTDGRGYFRVHSLAAGRYVVHTGLNPPFATERIYYPGTPNRSNAEVVTLSGGQDVALAELNTGVRHVQATADPEDMPIPGRARISGHVVRGDTGQPIAGGQVRIANFRLGVSTTVRTGSNGEFAGSGFAPGRYVITASADGLVAIDAVLVNPVGAGKTVDLKEREQVGSVDLVLVPLGSIEGHVLDEFGDPLPGVTVNAAQRLTNPGGTVLMPARLAGNLPTDDLGRFRCTNLIPGEYFLMVAAGPFAAETPSTFATAPPSLTGFAPTYFPGTDRADNAQTIHVEPGRIAGEVSFALVSAPMADLSGVVIDPNGQPSVRTQVILLPTENGELRSAMTARTSTAGDGTFVFRHVPAGSFVAQAFGPSAFGAVTVSVPSASGAPPADGVRVDLHPMRTARGRVVFEGTAPLPKVDDVRIGFAPTDFLSGPVGSNAILPKITADWAFEIPNLAWKGRLHVFAPTGWVLSRILAKGQDITSESVDFQTADVDGIEIVLTSHVGSVTGTTSNQSGPLEATVLIFRENQTAVFFDRVQALAPSDANGAFTVPALLPGRYLAVAVKLTAPVDAALLKAVQPFATPILVTDGGVLQLNLKIVGGK